MDALRDAAAMAVRENIAGSYEETYGVTRYCYNRPTRRFELNDLRRGGGLLGASGSCRLPIGRIGFVRGAHFLGGSYTTEERPGLRKAPEMEG